MRSNTKIRVFTSLMGRSSHNNLVRNPNKPVKIHVFAKYKYFISKFPF